MRENRAIIQNNVAASDSVTPIGGVMVPYSTLADVLLTSKTSVRYMSEQNMPLMFLE